VFSFTATPTAGTDARSTLPIRRAEKVVDPHPGLDFSPSYGATHRCLGW